jgi:hypothetical protein
MQSLNFHNNLIRAFILGGFARKAKIARAIGCGSPTLRRQE